eukprot:m.725899 g.725899  ORF g.725899 m.725899 type:complete len:151 (-) comp58849_c0_seq1:187-639(-)
MGATFLYSSAISLSVLASYEDLNRDPWSTLKHVMGPSGLWEMRNITDGKLAEVLMIERLRPRRGVQYSLRSSFLGLKASDVRWTLLNFRPILARYGYDEVYDIWLEALEHPETTDELVIEAKLLDAYERTLAMANWAEYWHHPVKPEHRP